MHAAVPRIRANQLWRSREAKCLRIISHALDIFRQRETFPEPEIELNREFYFCLIAASRELYPEDEVAPVTECCNQPDPDDGARARREQKRPDFQWIYLDRYEADPQRSSKQFVVECKRLGDPPRADWVLNLNYIEHGIARFKHPDWAYAKRAESGAMIGYIQSMTPHDILTDVNTECQDKSFPDLTPEGAWVPGGTTVSAVSAPLDRLYFEAGRACEKVSRAIWRFAWQMMDLLGATKLSSRAAETGVGQMM